MTLHHVELWVDDLDVASAGLGWMLQRLGWQPYQRWDLGRSWRSGDVYVVLEASPDRRPGRHDRLRAGLNHLALHGGTPQDVERISAEAQDRGFTLLFADRHPHAGGAHQHAAYLESPDGFEVELVASVASVAGDAGTWGEEAP